MKKTLVRKEAHLKRFFLVGLTLLGCQPRIFTDCADLLKVQTESPDGRYVAVLIERDCGATTDFSSLLSLRDARLATDDRDADIVLAVAGRSDITFEWTENRVLSVHLQEEEVVRRASNWRDVRIIYLTSK